MDYRISDPVISGVLRLFKQQYSNQIFQIGNYIGKYKGGMASGVKITNDGESIINAALALFMLYELYPMGKIKML